MRRSLALTVWLAHAVLLGSSLGLEHCAACRYQVEHGTLKSAAATVEDEWAEGEKSLLVIRADFADLPGIPKDAFGPLTEERLLETVNESVAPFFETMSYGKASVRLESDAITEVLRMPDNAQVYAQQPQLHQLQTDALAAADRAGVDTGRYDRVAIVVSSLRNLAGSQVNYSGFGWIGGRLSWFQGDFSAALVAHELGHNLGLDHASLWKVAEGKTDPFDPEGSRVEYGHPYDVMGSVSFDGERRNGFQAASLHYLNWLPDEAVHTVEGSGRFRVYQMDRTDADLKRTLAVRIAVDGSEAYWFSYRHRYSQLQQGLVVERVNEPRRSSLLLDMVPGGGLDDVALKEGQTFVDAQVGVTAKVVGWGGAPDPWVDLEIDYVPQIVFRQADQSTVEGSDYVEVVVERQRSFSGPVSVRWETLDLTATSPQDYHAASGTLTWADQEDDAQAIRIQINDDGLPEHEEAFAVRLVEVQGGVAPIAQATVHLIEPGAIDPSFQPPEIRGLVRDIALRSDGSIVLGGDFRQIENTHVRGLGLLSLDGSRDTRFVAERGIDWASVNRLAVDGQGRVLLGGDFSRYDSQAAEGLARISSTGSLDPDFVSLGLDGAVHDVVVLPNGETLVAGEFSRIDGHLTVGLARVAIDGQVDREWRSGLFFGSQVTAAARLPDGRWLVGGRFPNAEGLPVWGVIRLLPGGQMDRWLAQVEGQISGGFQEPRVTRIVLTPDGDWVVGGDFAKIEGHPANGLARLSVDGDIDAAFLEAIGLGPNGKIWDIEVTPDGRLLLAGGFDRFHGSVREGVARLEASGTLDGWNPGTLLKQSRSWSVLKGTALALQADGGVLIGLTESLEREGDVARVASGLTNLPGMVELEGSALTVTHGDSLKLAVSRRHGSRGSASVRYVVRMISEVTGKLQVLPPGRLFWDANDSETRWIRTFVPSDPSVSRMEVELVDAQGGVQIGWTRTVGIPVVSSNSRERWISAHFGAGGGVAVEDWSPEADPDEDSLSNLLEYALDRDPNQSSVSEGRAALPRATLGVVEGRQTYCLELWVDLPAVLRPDVRYEVVAGEDPSALEVLVYFDVERQEWVRERPQTPEPVRQPGAAAGRQWLRFQDCLTVGEVERRFMQLRVVLDPS